MVRFFALRFQIIPKREMTVIFGCMFSHEMWNIRERSGGGNMKYSQYWDKIYETNNKLDHLVSSYWKSYSSFDSWQFWVVAFLLIAPLILLYFTIDRKRIVEILFFGYTVHILWAYIDNALENNNFLHHTYFLFPMIPFSFDITGSVLPVGFLLVYQHCTNKNKNFYLYMVLLSLLFGFIFASIEKLIGLVMFSKGMNQFHLVLLDVVIALVSYWFTRLLVKVQKRSSE